MQKNWNLTVSQSHHKTYIKTPRIVLTHIPSSSKIVLKINGFLTPYKLLSLSDISDLFNHYVIDLYQNLEIKPNIFKKNNSTIEQLSKTLTLDEFSDQDLLNELNSRIKTRLGDYKDIKNKTKNMIKISNIDDIDLIEFKKNSTFIKSNDDIDKRINSI